MKKIFTLLTILGFSFAANAQLVSHNVTTHVSGDPSSELLAKATIVNTPGNPIPVRVLRTNTSLAAGHNSYFCWGTNCYTPSTFLSPVFILAPGDSNNLLAYAMPNGTNGTDLVNYQVYDTANATTDKISIDFTYDFATGINVLHSSDNYMNCAQSNIDDATTVTYNITNFKDGKFIIRNLLGSVVREIPLFEKQGVLSVYTSD